MELILSYIHINGYFQYGYLNIVSISSKCHLEKNLHYALLNIIHEGGCNDMCQYLIRK